MPSSPQRSPAPLRLLAPLALLLGFALAAAPPGAGGPSTRHSRTLGFDRIYVVNLSRRGDRRKYMERLGATYGLDFTFHAATDKCDAGAMEGIRARAGGVAGRLLNGQLGCWQSHVDVLRDAHVSGLETFLVLEDDVVIPDPELLAKVPLMLPLLEGREWDMLYLGAQWEPSKGLSLRQICHATKPHQGASPELQAAHDAECKGKGAAFGSGHVVVVPQITTAISPKGTHAYAVRGTSVGRLLEAIAGHGQPREAVDVLYAAAVGAGRLDALLLQPSVVVQGQNIGSVLGDWPEGMCANPKTETRDPSHLWD